MRKLDLFLSLSLIIIFIFSFNVSGSKVHGQISNNNCVNCAAVTCAVVKNPDPTKCEVIVPIHPNGCSNCCPELVCSSSSGNLGVKCVSRFSNCSCKSGCVIERPGETPIDCARACSIEETDPHVPNCKFIDKKCTDLNAPSSSSSGCTKPCGDKCCTEDQGCLIADDFENGIAHYECVDLKSSSSTSGCPKGCPLACPGCLPETPPEKCKCQCLCSSTTSSTSGSKVCGSGCNCENGKPVGLCEAFLCCDEDNDFCKCPEGSIYRPEDNSCLVTDGPTACTKEFAPVCGCDGVTYSNSCLAYANGIKKVSTGSCESNCKCPDGMRFDGKDCVLGDVACILLFDPVCGCDGVTYGNSCSAQAAGIKSFTNGECKVSSCERDKDCPIGKCENGKTYQKFSCLEGMCNEINFFAPPCQDFSMSNITRANARFNGIWKLKKKRDSEAEFQSAELKLCVNKEGVSGRLEIDEEILEGQITGHTISDNKKLLSLLVTDSSENTFNTDLELIKRKQLILTLEDGAKIKLKKVNGFKKCLKKLKKDIEDIPCPTIICAAPPEGCKYTTEKVKKGECPGCGKLECEGSSIDEVCSSKASCLGENNEEIGCPEGTECSGHPLYGCFPPNCPVPPRCFSPYTPIKTPGEDIPISGLRVGDIVLSDDGEPAKVIKASKTAVNGHKVLKIQLNDGTKLEVSPGHPTSDGRTFGELKLGDKLDGRHVAYIKLINYKYTHTYDILTDSKSGCYYANGVFVGSTLR